MKFEIKKEIMAREFSTLDAGDVFTDYDLDIRGNQIYICANIQEGEQWRQSSIDIVTGDEEVFQALDIVLVVETDLTIHVS